MTVGFLQSYSLLVIRTCHRRGVHAMGGMAAQIPIKNDPDANNAAIAKVLRLPMHLLNLHRGHWSLLCCLMHILEVW